MNVTEKEILALQAAVDQFLDMVEGGSEDERHIEHYEALMGLLKKVLVNEKVANTKLLIATDDQIAAIREQFSDCKAMIGGGDADVDQCWRRNQKMVNQMFKANKLPKIK